MINLLSYEICNSPLFNEIFTIFCELLRIIDIYELNLLIN